MARNNTPLEFTCSCGQLQGQIAFGAAHKGTHMECFCADCRAAELYFDQPDLAPGPVGLFQTMPHAITFTKGAEHLGLFRLSPRGTMRWYATCCNTPMFNTLRNPKLAFAGINTRALRDPDRIGPVVAKVHMPKPEGKTGQKGGAGLAWGIATRMLTARLSGQWRQTPFFDDTGEPVAKAVVPSKQERAALYPPHRRTKG